MPPGAARASAADPTPAAGAAYSGRAILVAFAAVVASFIAATAYSVVQAQRIDAMSDSIASISTVGIEHLAEIRTSARTLESLADAVRPGTRPGDEWKAELREASDELALDADAYRVLPLYVGENPLWAELGAAADDLDAAVTLALADDPAAVGRIHPAAERVLDGAARAIDLNARRSRELAVQIKSTRRRAASIGLGLDLLAAAVAAVAFVIVRREVMRYARVVREHSEFLEHRGDELEAFAARLAHDVRNPLSAAKLATELALRSTPAPRTRELVERAVRSLARAHSMMDALFEFARAGGAPAGGTRAGVRSVVEDLVPELSVAAQAERVELAIEPVPACEVACTPGALATVLSNLVRNAIKYMGAATLRRVSLRAHDSPEIVRFEVEDTGPGIAPELAGSIFDPYVRGATDRGGLGLGLATVKKLVEGHGGAVGFRSGAGAGSVFWFELPRAADAPEGRTGARPGPAGLSSGVARGASTP